MRIEKISAAVNEVIVSVREKFVDRVGNIFIDTSFHPEQHVTITGTVEAIPEIINNKIIGFEKCEPVLMPGDKIYFHYFTVDEDREIVGEGKTYYTVPYCHVFCYLREGEGLRAVGDWNLVEPTRYKMNGKQGRIFKVGAGLVKENENSGIYRAGAMEDKLKGKTVLFPAFARFRNVIEDKEYFLIPSNFIYGYDRE